MFTNKTRSFNKTTKSPQFGNRMSSKDNTITQA